MVAEAAPAQAALSKSPWRALGGAVDRARELLGGLLPRRAADSPEESRLPRHTGAADETGHGLSTVVWRKDELVTSLIIPKDTKIPAEVRRADYVTSHDSQESMLVAVVQGESRDPSEGELLACYEFVGVSPKPAGESRVAVTFRCHSRDEVEVEVRDFGTDRLLARRASDSASMAGLLSGDTSLLPTERAPYLDENVQFTVYRPEAVRPEKWYPMLAFAHLSERPPDASEDEPEPKEAVARQAAQILSEAINDYGDLTQDSRLAVPQEGEITFVPEIPGIEFDPPTRAFLWHDTVRREEFQLRASTDLDGKTARGRLTVFLGPFILADVSLSIRVDISARITPRSKDLEPATAGCHRTVFASYSHHDRHIVEAFRRYSRALGDRYLIDSEDLQVGEVWDERLMHFIREADIFQLFWSRSSMRSPFVRQEWEYALSLAKPKRFVRPVYWEEPRPEAREEGLPPEDLDRLHFTPLDLGGDADPSPASPLASEAHERTAMSERDLVAGSNEDEAIARRRGEDERPKLVLRSAVEGMMPNQQLPIYESPATVGSSENCTVTLKDRTVSGCHAEIERMGLVWFVTDLGSLNGVYVKGRSIRPDERHPIAGLDHIRFGTVEVQFLPDESHSGHGRSPHYSSSWRMMATVSLLSVTILSVALPRVRSQVLNVIGLSKPQDLTPSIVADLRVTGDDLLAQREYARASALYDDARHRTQELSSKGDAWAKQVSRFMATASARAKEAWLRDVVKHDPPLAGTFVLRDLNDEERLHERVSMEMCKAARTSGAGEGWASFAELPKSWRDDLALCASKLTQPRKTDLIRKATQQLATLAKHENKSQALVKGIGATEREGQIHEVAAALMAEAGLSDVGGIVPIRKEALRLARALYEREWPKAMADATQAEFLRTVRGLNAEHVLPRENQTLRTLKEPDRVRRDTTERIWSCVPGGRPFLAVRELVDKRAEEITAALIRDMEKALREYCVAQASSAAKQMKEPMKREQRKAKAEETLRSAFPIDDPPADQPYLRGELGDVPDELRTECTVAARHVFKDRSIRLAIDAAKLPDEFEPYGTGADENALAHVQGTVVAVCEVDRQELHAYLTLLTGKAGELIGAGRRACLLAQADLIKRCDASVLPDAVMGPTQRDVARKAMEDYVRKTLGHQAITDESQKLIDQVLPALLSGRRTTVLDRQSQAIKGLRVSDLPWKYIGPEDEPEAYKALAPVVAKKSKTPQFIATEKSERALHDRAKLMLFDREKQVNHDQRKAIEAITIAVLPPDAIGVPEDGKAIWPGLEERIKKASNTPRMSPASEKLLDEHLDALLAKRKSDVSTAQEAAFAALSDSDIPPDVIAEPKERNGDLADTYAMLVPEVRRKAKGWELLKSSEESLRKKLGLLLVARHQTVKKDQETAIAGLTEQHLPKGMLGFGSTEDVENEITQVCREAEAKVRVGRPKLLTSSREALRKRVCLLLDTKGVEVASAQEKAIGKLMERDVPDHYVGDEKEKEQEEEKRKLLVQLTELLTDKIKKKTETGRLHEKAKQRLDEKIDSLLMVRRLLARAEQEKAIGALALKDIPGAMLCIDEEGKPQLHKALLLKVTQAHPQRPLFEGPKKALAKRVDELHAARRKQVTDAQLSIVAAFREGDLPASIIGRREEDYGEAKSALTARLTARTRERKSLRIPEDTAISMADEAETVLKARTEVVLADRRRAVSQVQLAAVSTLSLADVPGYVLGLPEEEAKLSRALFTRARAKLEEAGEPDREFLPESVEGLKERTKSHLADRRRQVVGEQKKIIAGLKDTDLPGHLIGLPGDKEKGIESDEDKAHAELLKLVQSRTRDCKLLRIPQDTAVALLGEAEAGLRERAAALLRERSAKVAEAQVEAVRTKLQSYRVWARSGEGKKQFMQRCESDLIALAALDPKRVLTATRDYIHRELEGQINEEYQRLADAQKTYGEAMKRIMVAAGPKASLRTEQEVQTLIKTALVKARDLDKAGTAPTVVAGGGGSVGVAGATSEQLLLIAEVLSKSAEEKEREQTIAKTLASFHWRPEWFVGSHSAALGFLYLPEEADAAFRTRLRELGVNGLAQEERRGYQSRLEAEFLRIKKWADRPVEMLLSSEQVRRMVSEFERSFLVEANKLETWQAALPDMDKLLAGEANTIVDQIPDDEIRKAITGVRGHD